MGDVVAYNWWWFVLGSSVQSTALGKYAFSLLLSKEKAQPGISRFQALSAVLAATVGLGNISGVAIAIHMGGPGIIVWMVLTAFIGAVIKFYSCTLAVQLRQTDAEGNPLGGPMYYMTMGVKKWGKPMAVWFSIAGLFGVLPAFTTNQLTQTIVDVVQPHTFTAISQFNWKLTIGVVLAVASSFVIFGGLKTIVKVTSGLVPVMVLVFFCGAFYFYLQTREILPSLSLIFSSAFIKNSSRRLLGFGIIRSA